MIFYPLLVNIGINIILGIILSIIFVKKAILMRRKRNRVLQFKEKIISSLSKGDLDSVESEISQLK